MSANIAWSIWGVSCWSVSPRPRRYWPGAILAFGPLVMSLIDPPVIIRRCINPSATASGRASERAEPYAPCVPRSGNAPDWVRYADLAICAANMAGLDHALLAQLDHLEHAALDVVARDPVGLLGRRDRAGQVGLPVASGPKTTLRRCELRSHSSERTKSVSLRLPSPRR